VWSPDGKWLYIEASWKSFGDLYRVPREGGEPARLTAEPGGSFEPALSPDGATLAFASSRDGNAEIYRMPAHGGPATRLSEHPADDMAPRWGRDGRLTWLSRRSGAARFWSMNPEKPAEARILRTGGTDPEEEAELVLSADGQLAAITVQRPPDRVDIVLLRLSDGQVTGRLEDEGVDEHPAFSPDGQWVVFSSGRSGDVELWIVRPDGTGLRQLTDQAGADWLPRWLPPPSP
jgi:TolB protein